MIVGFGWGGWTTGGTADQVARRQADAAVTSALVPFCVANAKLDPTGTKKVGELRAISYSYEQQEFVMKTGWATMAGSTDPNRDVAEACASQLLKTAEAK
jgi:hypothetical protein